MRARRLLKLFEITAACRNRGGWLRDNAARSATLKACSYIRAVRQPNRGRLHHRSVGREAALLAMLTWWQRAQSTTETWCPCLIEANRCFTRPPLMAQSVLTPTHHWQGGPSDVHPWWAKPSSPSSRDPDLDHGRAQGSSVALRLAAQRWTHRRCEAQQGSDVMLRPREQAAYRSPSARSLASTCTRFL